MTRKRQWRIVGAVYVVLALLVLALCTGQRLDIRIVGVVPEISGRVAGIERPLELSVSVGTRVTDDEILQWAAEKCRDNLILPPVETVPIIKRYQPDPQTGRQQVRITCYRDKWSVPE